MLKFIKQTFDYNLGFLKLGNSKKIDYVIVSYSSFSASTSSSFTLKPCSFMEFTTGDIFCMA